MAKQANTMMIGAFVVFAVLLLATSVVIFGSGKVFKKVDKYILHFDTSIKGLNVGAPVLFNGVPIGTVIDIVMLADHESLDYIIPVYIEIDPSIVKMSEKRERIPAKTILPKLIDRGLRGMLTMKSLITGQLVIELGYYPETPIKLKKTDKDILEIPTIPSTSQRLIQTLQEVDFHNIIKNIERSVSGLSMMINDPESANAIHSLKHAADGIKEVTDKINRHIDPLAKNLDGTISDSRKLINNIDTQVQPLSSDLKRTIDDLNNLILSTNANIDSLVQSLEKSLESFRGLASEDAPIVIKVEDTLQNISDMSRSIRQLADYLERHPEALLKGKKK